MNVGIIVFLVAAVCCSSCSALWTFGSSIPGINTYVKPVTSEMSYSNSASFFCMACIWLFVLFWFFVLRPFGMKATATGLSAVL